MKNVKVVITRAQRQKLLRSRALHDDLAKRADKIRDAAGGTSMGYLSDAGIGPKRARASVVTGNGRAVRDNAANNSLVRAMDAGRRV